MARTTIARDLIEAIKLGKADKDAILRDLAAATHGAEAMRRGAPAVTVRFHVMRKPERKLAELARGTRALDEDEPIYELTKQVPLYALDDAARVDVLRFGRSPDQDVQLLDPQVSREHGLVIYAGGLPLFCDYGTLKDGAHAGSMNGTYMDGVTQIRDSMLQWFPGRALMLGEATRDRSGRRRFAISLTYELHPIPPSDDPFGN